MTQGDRYESPRIVLGEQVFTELTNAKVLVVGAGGIGCELLKNMVMTGFGSGEQGHIELLDLDTIDLSNLNRQFLFQKQHVKRPKSVVARETALKFNPNVKIKALHRNIKDTDFNVSYFKSFSLVLNALDNLDARRHVNKMCLAAGIPLIESGTSGYRGQVQPIYGNARDGGEEGTDCFDCTGKPVPKTFAVCTIRSTPSTAHHCIAWSKSYLFPQLFGADDESDQQELDDAEKNGENVDEIQELRKEALAVKELRSTLSQPGAAKRIFEKVYEKDIERLLQMTDMWKHRKPPHKLSFAQLEQQTKDEKGQQESATQGGGVGGIKDQRKLSLLDSFKLFIDSVERLTKRIDPTGQTPPLSFDKDDDDTLDFVVSSANLRASAFDIESQTRFQVKEYAGNIIPAIATTNAIIAGSIVLQSLAFFKSRTQQQQQGGEGKGQKRFKDLAKSVWLNRQSDKVFDVGPCSSPNPYCAVCRIVYVPLRFKKSFTLGEFVKAVTVEGELKLGGEEERISVMEGSRLLFETEDFEDNEQESLESLNCGVGKFLTVENDDNDWPVSFSIGSFLPEDEEKSFELDLSSFPSPIPKKPLPPPTEENKSNGEDADDDIAFAIDGQEDDDLMIIEPGDSTTTTSTTTTLGKAKDLYEEAVQGQTVTEEQGTISGKKRSAGEAELGGDGTPVKKEAKVVDEKEKEQEEGEKGEKQVEVVDLT